MDATTPLSAIDASRVLARGYGSLRSVLLRNSVRAPWPSPSRSSSHSRRAWSSARVLGGARDPVGAAVERPRHGLECCQALTGNSVGLLAGVALFLAAATHEAVLWAPFPPAVLLAAYAPQAISFAAGGGFTLTLVIL